MRLLLCLDGGNTERLLAAVAELVRVAGAETRLIHVLDSEPADLAGHLRERYIGRERLGMDWRAQLDAALRERGIELLRAAEAQVIALACSVEAEAGSAPALPAVSRALLAGRPEREIVGAAAAWPATLVALCARTHDWPAPPPGPRSVGHVARYVTDHAPCPVLLVRP